MRERPAAPGRRPRVHGGFTLLELLVVMGILGLLAALLWPVLGRARAAGQRAVCANNLRHLNLALLMYWQDHDGRFFPFREQTPEGDLWYWGLETGGGPEGSRKLDKSRARLAAYLPQVGGVEICPAFPYGRPYFKQKFEIPSYGYGLNVYLLDGTPESSRCPVRNAFDITQPAQTITFADAAQINTWQAPASPSRPMLEEWYYLDGKPPPKFHFRHGGLCNAAFADGSVRSLKPHRLDSRCDGLTGYLEPGSGESLLRPDK